MSNLVEGSSMAAQAWTALLIRAFLARARTVGVELCDTLTMGCFHKLASEKTSKKIVGGERAWSRGEYTNNG